MQKEAGKKATPVTIGVLAYQGGVEEHFKLLSRVPDVKAVLIDYPHQLDELDGLIIPGGESTTMLKLMVKNGMDTAIKAFHSSGKCLWGTCAGLIVLGSKIVGENYQPLALIDIEVERNAYGTQLDSFITREKVEVVSSKKVELVFIRAPRIASMGADVKALLSIENTVVFAQSPQVMVTAFHPELTSNKAFHAYFAEMVRNCS